MAVEELEVGLVAFAAPVRDHTGELVWALSVSGPRYRLDPNDAQEIVTTVTAAAADLSRLFGYRAAGSTGAPSAVGGLITGGNALARRAKAA